MLQPAGSVAQGRGLMVFVWSWVCRLGLPGAVAVSRTKSTVHSSSQIGLWTTCPEPHCRKT